MQRQGDRIWGIGSKMDESVVRGLIIGLEKGDVRIEQIEQLHLRGVDGDNRRAADRRPRRKRAERLIAPRRAGGEQIVDA